MLLVHEPDKQALSMILYDQQDFVANDKIIGQASLPIKDMTKGERVDEWISVESVGSFQFGDPVTMGIQVKLLSSQNYLLLLLCRAGGNQWQNAPSCFLATDSFSLTAVWHLSINLQESFKSFGSAGCSDGHKRRKGCCTFEPIQLARQEA